MDFLTEEYWSKFLNVSTTQKGKKFEDLVKDILDLHYGENCWRPTKASWDGSKDFFWYYDNEKMWAECKNYKHTIGLKVVSNSLIMAEIYNVSTLLFFSYSFINENTKLKILKYADDEKMRVFFYDDIALENLIFQYWDSLRDKYFPKYTNDMHLTTRNPKVLFKTYKNPLDYKSDDCDSLDDITLFHMFEIDVFLINETPEKQECSIQFSKRKGTPIEAFDIYPDTLKRSPVTICLEAFSSCVYKIYITPCVFSSQMKLPNVIVTNNNFTIKNVVGKYETKTFRCNAVDTQRLIGQNYTDIVKSFSGSMRTQKGRFHALCIEGESGTGKSKLLNYCIIDAKKSGKHVLKFNSSFSGDDVNLTASNLIKEIIISLYDLASEDIVNIIQQSLLNDETKLDESVRVAFTMISEFLDAQTDTTYKMLIDKYIEVIFEKLSSREYLLAIDNVQFFDKSILYFIQNLILLGVNSNHTCKLCILLAINTDYLAGNVDAITILNVLKDFKITKEIHGFTKPEDCEEFLQELLFIGNATNEMMREKIITKTNNNPYFITQYVRWLDDLGYLERKDNHYVIKDSIGLEKTIEEMPSSIEELLDKRWGYCIKYNGEEKCSIILSSIHLWEYLLEEDIERLGIERELLLKLQQMAFVSISESQNIRKITIQHDLLEKFLVNHYPNFASLSALYAINENVSIFRKEFQQAFIRLHGLDAISLEKLGYFVAQIPSQKLAAEYYKVLFEKVFEFQPCEKNLDDWLKIVIDCYANYRDSLGSEALLTKLGLLNKIEQNFTFIHKNDKYAMLLLYLSEALDAVGEYEQAYELIATHVKKIESEADLLKLIPFQKVLVEAYNRLHVYRRHQCTKPLEDFLTIELLEKSENMAKKIEYYKFQYVNNSDRGYLYYALPINNEKSKNVFIHWENACRIFESYDIPEKTLNYYRKRVQLCLLNKKNEDAINFCIRGIEYIKDGTYAYQKLFFYWWFYLALIECYLQKNPTRYFNEIEHCIKRINQYELLLNSTKKFYILQLKAVFFYYKEEIELASATNKECMEVLHHSKYKCNMDYLPMQLEHNQYVIEGIEKSGEVSSLVHTNDQLFNLPCL